MLDAFNGHSIYDIESRELAATCESSEKKENILCSQLVYSSSSFKTPGMK